MLQRNQITGKKRTALIALITLACIFAMAMPGATKKASSTLEQYAEARATSTRDASQLDLRAPSGTHRLSTLPPINLISTPDISSISPSRPTAGGLDQNITVSGSGFMAGLTVSITFPGGGGGTLSGSQIRNVTSGSFVMVATLGATSTWGIRVNNPDGGQSDTFTFTVRSAPTIDSISPSSPARSNNDQNVQVSGNNFVSGLTVTVFIPGGGTATLSGTQIQNVGTTSFRMVITLNVLGTYGIRVNNPGGAQSNIFNFNVQNATPSISSISPSTPTRSDSDQSVQVSGSNFLNGLTVTVFIPGGGSATLSGTQIQGVSSSSFTMIITLNVAGNYGIRVNNPGGGQSSTFNFNVQNATPSISSISPSTPTRSDSDQSVQVSGSNFLNGLTATVFIPGGGSATLSGTQIQGVSSSSFTMIITLNVAGNYGIRVNNPGGGQSSTFNFNVQNATPSISSISPSTPTRSDSDQSVQVSGSNFLNGLTVTVFIPGGGSATLSGTQIQGVSSSSFTMIITLNVAGNYGIRVNNPGGGQSSTFNFNVQAVNPSISSISPTTPAASPTDQNVTVSGANFQPNLTVSVTFPGGGSATLSGTQVQSVSANSFVMRITLGVAGSWSIRVNNSDGGQSSSFGFSVQSVIQAPSVFSIDPSTPLTNANDQNVTVSGNNFQPNLTVTVNFPGGGSGLLSGTQIQNVTPSSFVMRVTLGAAGGWSMRVNNPDGGQSSLFNFNVATAGQGTAISSINPTTPMTNGADQDVTVTGSGFQAGLRVDVGFPGGGLSTLQGTGQIQKVIANSFLMRITLNAAGSWNMRVVNPDGSQSAQFSFNVQASTPPPSGLPASVLSPVLGPLRVTSTNLGTRDGKWEFNQHKGGAHTPTGGISLSNDSLAWDVNLYTQTSGNEDAGKTVFAVADGEVISYVGTQPGAGPGAVLVAHPNAQNPVWFSGYLHMTNVRVSLNQTVNVTTVIGEIGRTGANNDHLHFVVYSGQNTRGNLQSFNATILERSTASGSIPTISSIQPGVVTQSSTAQLVTIAGTNFQSNSILEGQSPNRQYFSVTTEPNSVGDEARIVDITPNAITAMINFSTEGTYAFSVINRPGSSSGSSAMNTLESQDSFSVSASNTVEVVPSGRTPVIVIPGILGSRIAKRRPDGTFQELWLAGIFNDDEHGLLGTEVEDPSKPYRAITARNIVATEILKDIGIPRHPINVYGKLIDYLTSPSVGYTLYDVSHPTLALCDTTRKDADLFVFPYDWRNSNITSAKDLRQYVQCIKNIRGNPPNFKVHIIAHSMGGLVARRYILDNPTTHHVERMVTLGTPWLGAPTAINILETGNYGIINLVINSRVLKEIAPFIRGAHELVPSRAYDDGLDHLVLGENGWNDFDFIPEQTTRFDFSRLKTAMNLRYQPFGRPGDNTDTFHQQAGQDIWTSSNLFGVEYYNFVGYDTNTIGTLMAIKDASGKTYLDPHHISGDGTVPLSSALRYRPGRTDLPNFRGNIKREFGFEKVDHNGLISSGQTFPYINCVVNVPDADACINRLQSGAALMLAKGPDELVANLVETVATPTYLLRVSGSPFVLISDSFGNTTSPLSTSMTEGVSTVQTEVTGTTYLSASFPLDQNYRVVIRSATEPLSVLLTKSQGQSITEAIRYVGVTLPADVFALLELTPQGVSSLRYDKDRDGSFETTIVPTISVTGASAQDVEAPVVTISETVQNGVAQITFSATDAGTGVKQIMYSTNGSSFQQYTGTLSLSALQTPTVSVFADDNVANRSGVRTHRVSGPVAIAASQSSLKSWTFEGRTYAYVRLDFSDSGYRVANWGTPVRAGNGFSANAVVERVSGESIPAASNTAQIYDLGALAAGNYTFAFKNSGSTVKTLNFSVSGTPPSPNLIDQSREFVRWQYKDFLRREPDGPGWDHWTGEITMCSDPAKRFAGETQSQCVERKRANTSAAFFLSPEFINTGYFVLRVYRGSLGRMPHFGGTGTAQDEFTRDAGTVANGIVVNNKLAPAVINANKQAFVQQFVTRAEFRAIYDGLSNSQYVDKLFQTTGVTPASTERQALIDGLTNGSETRASVLFKVVDGTETVTDGHLNFNTAYGKAFYDKLFNAAFVQMEYFGYLLRDPDAGGYSFWLGKLNQFGNWVDAQMVLAFIKSPEYRSRFGAP